MPDPWSESRGMIEIGTKQDTGEFKPMARFGPNGESEEEWLRESKKNTQDIASALSVLAQNQSLLTEFLMKQAGNVPVVDVNARPVVTDEPIGMTAAEAAASVGGPTEEIAPCGARIKARYLKQHQRFCNHPDCGGAGENTTGPEAA